jgi:hypothetical protein
MAREPERVASRRGAGVSHRQQPERILTALIPEFMSSRGWEHLLHNQSALRLKGSLLFRPGIVAPSVPYHISPRPEPKR